MGMESGQKRFTVQKLLSGLASYYEKTTHADLPFGVQVSIGVPLISGSLSSSVRIIATLSDMLSGQGRIVLLEITGRQFFSETNPYEIAPGSYAEFVMKGIVRKDCKPDSNFIEMCSSPRALTGISQSVKARGGALLVSSSPDAAMCRFVLPSWQSQDCRERTAESEAVTTIMVVENDESVLQLVESGLRLKGYSVIAVRSGDEALKTLQDRAEHISLVLSDAVLPQTDGRTFVRNACTLRPHLKIILSSTFNTSDNFDCLKDVECGAYISKPYPLGDLFSLIDSLLHYH